MDIAGHVSKQMLKHYSHIRMEARRTALESILKKPKEHDESKKKTHLYPQLRAPFCSRVATKVPTVSGF
jgi:hypothetical protein